VSAHRVRAALRDPRYNHFDAADVRDFLKARADYSDNETLFTSLVDV
jgi:hypothetical protein